MSATDPDCGVNAIVNYTMGDGLSKYREFEVNPSSGEICIGAPLDHEKRSIYEFPILATDRGTNAVSFTAINIIDTVGSFLYFVQSWTILREN